MPNKTNDDPLNKIKTLFTKNDDGTKFLSDDLRGVIKGSYDLEEIRKERLSNYLKDN